MHFILLTKNAKFSAVPFSMKSFVGCFAD